MKAPRVAISVSYGLPRKGLPSAQALTRWAAAAVGSHRTRAEVSVRLVDAAEGQALNLRYRHKDYATNVLSFCAELPPEVDLPFLGDVVLCDPVVRREAKDQGKTVADHYAHLTVHGVLHLLGHDHETVSEARDMEALEIQILDSLGISNPYAER
jgi:probable rRNA maturation factor